MCPGTQAVETSGMPWKSGSVVRLTSGGEAMTVIGCDSVGSVNCRPLSDERHLGIYVPPSLLVVADAQSNAGASGHSTDMATENA